MRFAPRAVGALVLRQPVESFCTRGGGGLVQVFRGVVRSSASRWPQKQQQGSATCSRTSCHRQFLLTDLGQGRKLRLHPRRVGRPKVLPHRIVTTHQLTFCHWIVNRRKRRTLAGLHRVVPRVESHAARRPVVFLLAGSGRWAAMHATNLAGSATRPCATGLGRIVWVFLYLAVEKKGRRPQLEQGVLP